MNTQFDILDKIQLTANIRYACHMHFSSPGMVHAFDEIDYLLLNHSSPYI